MNSIPSLRQPIYEMLPEPFYKTRLDVVFKWNGGIDWDRWHEIPIVIFKAVEKTPLNSGGKHQRIVCEIPA